VAAAYRVLRTYSTAPAAVAALDAARAASLGAIPDGQAKDDGIAVGEDAAAAMIALRANDGSAPPAFFEPAAPAIGGWQATPSCPVNPATGLRRGAFYHWPHVTPFAIPSAWAFRPEPPPAIGSYRYFMAHREVMAVGGMTSIERPADRADVARFFAAFSNVNYLSQVARQVALARGDSLADNARNFALIAMAANDAFIGSFEAKYHYGLWRPETAIRAGDGNQWTEGDAAFVPFITAPCFPSYPSNHASGSGAALEMLRRLYGEAGHDLTLEVPALPGLVMHYTAFHQMLADVSDARVYGGIHFRFDQEAGDRLGREVATFVIKEYLRPVHP
jgi:PAP2 superfamily